MAAQRQLNPSIRLRGKARAAGVRGQAAAGQQALLCGRAAKQPCAQCATRPSKSDAVAQRGHAGGAAGAGGGGDAEVAGQRLAHQRGRQPAQVTAARRGDWKGGATADGQQLMLARALGRIMHPGSPCVVNLAWQANLHQASRGLTPGRRQGRWASRCRCRPQAGWRA